MDPRDTILLCLGDFPVPIISATPGSVIPWNDSVKILCWGTPESYLYQLEILGNSTFEVVEKKLGFQKKAEFLIKHMNPNTAGRYQCQYRKQDHWSEHSKALELVVTDIMKQDYTVGNLIRMGVAGLVLVALLAILVKNWHNHQAPNKEDCPDLSELSWSKQKCQT
ncbi:immunoglobulin alpha Fc receptor isoform X6 [Mirounga angustirostris]|uniref:immunoglobulin alpha Fc receptor isoform X6 n=1 Tax=Mirounga angustirostris TaxID=9716 RepID=UPI0023E42991|nr:immunoglobulin alpha Fc receptor-like isoform X6 [Mirounga angustirostris]